MNFDFFKYNSNGNDFIIIDETKKSFSFTKEKIQKLCSRQFCIGADGLVILQNSSNADYKMRIFNSDGSEANMCGNALLCLVKFIYDHIKKKDSFLIETKSFIYETFVENDVVSFKADFPKIISENNKLVIEKLNLNFPVLDSGVLHGIIFFEKIDDLDVFNLGKKIRNYHGFMPKGINVNFCQKISDNEIKVRTYERGVEDETFCCSTGALAVAFDIYRRKKIIGPLTLLFKGGNVTVSIDKNNLKLTKEPKFCFYGKCEPF